jgi:beta-N-acetylhexosaminidase
MLDLPGIELDGEDKDILRHPMVGGLIFFGRNYECHQQITDLVRCIREVRPDILICVDHEGGRVQRFREEFTRLPALQKLGQLYERNPNQAADASTEMAWLMAAELRDVGIDFSFAPVLDINYERCDVIGDRSFHQETKIITELAKAYVEGLHQAGMASVGKHFPGHGYVNEDSHLDLPVDDRSLDDIWHHDVSPFDQLNQSGLLDAVMPAHVIYEQVDSSPAGFSSIWIKELLRERMSFDGVVFSDDLNMAAAHVAGSFTDRADAAMKAGCDMILACNNRPGAIEILDNFSWEHDADSVARLNNMKAKKVVDSSAKANSDRCSAAINLAEKLITS